MTMTQLRGLFRRVKGRSKEKRELNEEVEAVILRKSATAGYVNAAEAKRFWKEIASREMICTSCEETAPLGVDRCPKCTSKMV